jgi:hypothetical protein
MIKLKKKKKKKNETKSKPLKKITHNILQYIYIRLYPLVIIQTPP